MPLTASDLALTRSYLDDIGTSEQQSLTITNATGGTFTLSWGGYTCTPLAWNADAGTVQNALAALTSIGIGNVHVNNINPYTIFFAGTLGNAPQAIITANGSGLTGAGATATVTELLQGGATAFTDVELSANYDQALGNLFLGVSYGFVQLWSSAAKFNTYSLGQTAESKDQIFKHLGELVEKFERLSRASAQVQMAGMVPVPPRVQSFPWVSGSSSQNIGTIPPWQRYRNGWMR